MAYSSEKPTEALSKFAASLRFEDIPADVIESMKLYILDTLGCGLLGSKDPRNGALVEVVRRMGGTSTSTVWGYDLLTSPSSAALVNGSFVHSYDFDDQCQDVGLHAGACAIPAALGYAEYRRGVTGRQLLTSCVAGYEVAMRAGHAVGLEPLRRGWHPAGFNGTFAAAVAVGKLIDLDQTKMGDAIGLASTQGAGLMGVQYGSDAKGMNCGRAAQGGVMAALLAELGFKGISEALERPYGGYAHTLADSPDLSRITAGLGTSYLTLEKLALKAYPGVRWVHCPIEAMEEILAKHPLRAQDIRRITVLETRIGVDHVGWDYAPEGVTSSLCNAAFAIALLLLKGSNDPRLYNLTLVNDPEILSLCSKVIVRVDEERERTLPNSMGAVVKVETVKGEILSATVEEPKGTPGKRPMSKADVERKFLNIVDDEEVSDSVREIVYDLEGVKDSSELGAALARGRLATPQRLN